jgi:hypothetical protein
MFECGSNGCVLPQRGHVHCARTASFPQAYCDLNAPEVNSY